MTTSREIGTYTQVQRDRYVELYQQHANADPSISNAEIARRAARDGTRRGDTVPSEQALIRWVKQAGIEIREKAKPASRTAEARDNRETQRQRLIALIDLEIDRTALLVRKITTQTRRSKQSPDTVEEVDASLVGVNFAQRLQALASAHATLATQSRADELHGLRMGDINPQSPANSLDDWDGDMDRLPPDLPESVVDLDATRRAAQALSANGAS